MWAWGEGKVGCWREGREAPLSMLLGAVWGSLLPTNCRVVQVQANLVANASKQLQTLSRPLPQDAPGALLAHKQPKQRGQLLQLAGSFQRLLLRVGLPQVGQQAAQACHHVLVVRQEGSVQAQGGPVGAKVTQQGGAQGQGRVGEGAVGSFPAMVVGWGVGGVGVGDA